MNLLNMTNRIQIHEFYKKDRGNFYLSSQFFQIWGLISGMKVMIKNKIQLDISKTQGHRV